MSGRTQWLVSEVGVRIKGARIPKGLLLKRVHYREMLLENQQYNRRLIKNVKDSNSCVTFHDFHVRENECDATCFSWKRGEQLARKTRAMCVKENGQHSDEILFYHTITRKHRNNRLRTVFVFLKTTDLADSLNITIVFRIMACFIRHFTNEETGPS